eukprot:Amastigsp_a512685_14.p5 type:complete len:105 gc:universal Amastigsp_a512685_14:972-658(-)
MLSRRHRCSLPTSMSTPSVRSRWSLRRSEPSAGESKASRLMASGTKSAGSSSSVCTATIAATIEPTDEPEMTRGSSLASSSALTTPMWYMPIAAPPESSSAVRP